jgi:LPXTG-motif cell wall-anchored protein
MFRPVNRARILACLLAFALAAPSAAFAQGAGDDQYQDPLPDTPVQNGGGDGGLSEAPPGGAGSGFSGSSGSGTAGGSQGTGEGAPADPAAQDTALPNTGSDPRVLAWIAVLFLLAGIGLRLRTIDPDEY